LVFSPLAYAARDGLDPAVGSRGDPPQETDVSSRNLDVEALSDYHEIDVAPLVDLAAGVGTENNSLADFKGVVPAQDIQVAPNGRYNC
jgi:hypothetical protein